MNIKVTKNYSCLFYILQRSKKMLEKIPPEMFAQITNKLTDRDRNTLLKVSKEFYDFIQEFYVQTLYGNTLGLIRFMNHQLPKFTKDIVEYKKSQKFSFFNRQQRENTWDDGDLRWDICKFIIVGVLMISNFYPHLKAYLLENKPVNFSLQGGRIIFPLIFIGIIALTVHSFNASLLQRTIDTKTIEALNKLKRSYPLLDKLGFQYDQTNTHFQINDFLDKLSDIIKNTLQKLNQYCNNIRGSNIQEINLDNVIDDKNAKKILEHFITQWNNDIPNSAKTISYRRN